MSTLTCASDSLRFNEAEAIKPRNLPSNIGLPKAKAIRFNEAEAIKPRNQETKNTVKYTADAASMRPRPSSLGIYGWPSGNTLTICRFNEAEAIKPRNLKQGKKDVSVIDELQ